MIEFEGAKRGIRLAAVVFDMDGVITRTARLHAAAWKELFDDFLRRRDGDRFRPFEEQADYLAYVDGKPREEGARSFLAARGIRLAEGGDADDPGADTIHALSRRKDALFEARLRRDGVEAFGSTLELVRRLRERAVKTGVVTSSRHGHEVLAAAGVEHLFDVRLDGADAERLRLPGKPDPAMFLRCAELLGVAPGHCAVVEDAVSGVAAARRGGFGLVVGVDRGGNRDALAGEGADVVVGDLAELELVPAAEQDADPTWRIEQEGFDPARERAMESLFTVGNGYLGARGALDAPLPGSQADLLVAGIYDRKQPGRPYSEPEFLHLGHAQYPYTELASLPLPFRVRVAIDGEPLDLAGERWRAHSRVLDMRLGALRGECVYETLAGRRITVRSRRIASAVDLHLLLQEIAVRVDRGSGEIELDASLDDADLAAEHPHLAPLEARGTPRGMDVRRYATRASGFEICLASRTTLAGSGEDRTRWRAPAAAGRTLTFRRYIVVYTSRDVPDPTAAAIEHLGAQRWEGFDDVAAAHAARWTELWARADVTVAGSRAAQQALRFNIYHLSIAADHDPRVSVGARSLSGRAYEGHVFWDVEIFMLPFYLHTQPEIARALLGYRHATLDGARRRARELGYRGACYAWESTVTGDDATPRKILLRTTRKEIPIFTGTEQVHVTADVALGVWRYWDATGDREFLSNEGAEIFVETARFWVSRCTPEDGRYHIRGVVGPDEYHHTVNDNAYTNWLARFNLERAAWVAEWLGHEFPAAWGELAERCAIGRVEPAQWAATARSLYCPAPGADGVIEQFEGFFDLEAYSLPKEERFKAPISRLFDWDRINRLRLIKQADVLMLLHLFPDAFPREVVAANYRYYEPITDHGSSLSPAIHAAIAARLGLCEDAERYWRQSLALDLSNVMANSTLGVHPACMGGTWQALVFGFLGVRFTEEGPVADPEAAARLPASWRAVALTLAYRGRSYPIEVSRAEEVR
jgi:beta-phosphoglucomutase family hydrolase